MIKFSAFADEISDDLKEQMDVLEKHRINHIELRGVWGKNVLDLSDEELKKVKGMMDERGFKVSSIGSPIGKVGINEPFEPYLEAFKKIVSTAKFLGSKYIRIFSFYIPKGEDPAKYRDEVMRRLKVFAEIAEKEGVILCHENEKEIYGDTGERCKDIIETVNSKNLRAVFDPANFVQVGQRPFEECYPLLKDYIEYIHVKDALLSDGSVVPAGKGDGGVAQLFKALKESGFEGFTSLEPHLKVAGKAGGFTGPELFNTALEGFYEVLDEVGMPYKRLGYGIIGCGVIGSHHGRYLRDVDDAWLVAVCDIIEDRAKEIGEKLGVDYYTDYKEMLGRDDIDVVSVCTPSGMHANIAVDVAKAKKHVVSEKPIDITLENADRMIEACKENGVTLSVISQHRFDKGIVQLKKAIDEGKLGKLVLGDAYVKWFRTQGYYDNAGWRGTWAMDGGGALMNQSVHYVDQLLWMMGDVESVYANMATLAHNIEVEDVLVANLKFKSGALGTIEASTAVYPGMVERLEIHGTKGTMILEGEEIKIEEIAYEGREIPPYGLRVSMVQPKPEEEDTGEVVVPGAASHVLQLRDICDAIVKGVKPLVTGEDGRKALELILAIYKSAKTGEVVKLPL